MPGSIACGRCGASLRLAATTIGIHPPRAGALTKQWRRWVPLRNRYFYAVRDLFRKPLLDVSAFFLRGVDLRELSSAVIVRMIVPGWAQIYRGQARRGQLFLFPWLVLLFLSVLCLGSTASGWCFGFLISLHAMSIVDLFARFEGVERGRRLVVCFLVLALVSMPYILVVTQSARVISVRQFLADAEPFSSGDVVLYRPRAYLNSGPQIGDVVIYRNRPYRTGGVNGLYVYDGEWVNRIVAAGGSHVVWKNSQLTVDGQPAEHLPLNASRLPAAMEVLVPADCFCILPTTIPNPGAPLDKQSSEALSIVDRTSILGKVIVRNYPPHRWWWLN